MISVRPWRLVAVAVAGVATEEMAAVATAVTVAVAADAAEVTLRLVVAEPTSG